MNAALVAAGHTDISFQVVVSDSRNDPPTAVARSTALVRQQGAKALVLDTSQNTIAVNSLAYDSDPTNDLSVPTQCSSCTSGSINNPTATNADPVQQLALRNSQKWQFRNIMASSLSALVIDRDLLKLGTAAADVNGDGKVKIAFYNSDEAFGNSSVSDAIKYAQLLQTNPPLLYEQHKFPSTANLNSYDWAADMELLTNNFNERTNTSDGVPDFIVVPTFAQYYIPILKTWQISGFNQRVPRIACFANLRTQSAVNALGTYGVGIEGISTISITANPSGDIFAQEVMDSMQRTPSFREADFYDNALTMLLGAWRAAQTLPDPTAVTGAQIRDAMPGLADLSAMIVRPGVASLTTAVQALDAGATINYEGASGPIDYDANQNVKNQLSHYRIVENELIADLETYDCIKVSDASTLAAAQKACPRVPSPQQIDPTS